MIRLTKDIDNIVTLSFDMQGQAHNLLNHEVADSLVPVLAYLKQQKEAGALRGIMLTSAKASFMFGGTREHLADTISPAALSGLTSKLKQVLRELELPGVPVVAALNGSALGTGFELALACHHRIAIGNAKATYGLPDIKVGLMPSAGGCIRLMHLLGLKAAYQLLTSGEKYTAQEALSHGLIDAVVTSEAALLDQARDFIFRNSQGTRRWDKGATIPGGNARTPDVAAFIVSETAQIAAKHRTRYPAYAAILSTLAEGSKVDFDTALNIETQRYVALATGPVAHNMVQALDRNREELNSGASRPRGYGKFRVRNVGIIGAGEMGLGIGYACARAELNVVIKDVSRAVAMRGRLHAERSAAAEVERGTLVEAEATLLLARITFTEQATDLEACDLLIEAVFENENVKRKVIREAGHVMDEYAILASNTLSIPISTLAQNSPRPEQFIGLHFFPPAASVPLVEIVRGELTSEETVARAFDFVKGISKVPILVKDSWGFYVARVQNTYILEGITMLLDGYPAALIDNIGVQLGMPLGPLALADRLGLAFVQKYEQQAALHYGDRYVQHPAVAVLEAMLLAERQGKTSGGGFYAYGADAPLLWEGLSDQFPVTQGAYNRTDLEERILFAQTLEAGWCLQEKVLTRVAEANVGSIYGWGFPANYGGVIQYAQQYEKGEFLNRAAELEHRHGPRFGVPPVLKDLLHAKTENVLAP